jgi:hypothetical protein
VRAKILAVEETGDEPARRAADHHGIWLGDRLQPRGDVWRLAECESLGRSAFTNLAHDDEPGMNADACLDGRHAIRLPARSIAGSKCRDNVQAGLHRAARIVLVRLRIAEVDEQSVAEILRDLPFEAVNDRGTGALIVAHDCSPVFGIESLGQRRRPDQIAEHHGKLAALAGGLHVQRRGRALSGDSGCRRRCGQSRPAATAELFIRLVEKAAGGTRAGERQTAPATEAAAFAILCVAPRAPHRRPRTIKGFWNASRA